MEQLGLLRPLLAGTPLRWLPAPHLASLLAGARPRAVGPGHVLAGHDSRETVLVLRGAVASVQAAAHFFLGPLAPAGSNLQPAQVRNQEKASL